MVSAMAGGRRGRTVTPMHALFVTDALRDSDPGQHFELCEQLAPAVAAVPGLLQKTRLANGETGRFGGFYVFASRADSSGTSRASCSTHCCRRARSVT